MESSQQHLISNDYTEVYQRLPAALQLAYGIGHVLNDVCASMWFTYLLVYFHLVLEFNNWEAGFMLLVGQVADALATPFVGFQSDQLSSSHCYGYGKRKIWHLVGTFCVIGAFPFIFSPSAHFIDTQKWIEILYYCVFIVIFQFGWAAVQISHLSLIPELTPNEHDRTRLTAIRCSLQAYTEFTNSEMRHFNMKRIKNSSYMFEVTKDEIIMIVKQINNKSSEGYDEIPMDIICKTITNKAEPRAYIIYTAFTEGIFPGALKLQ